MTISRIYNGVLRYFLKKTFSFWQLFGFHITPNHYYQPIPDTRELSDDLWTKQSALVGIDFSEADQVSLLEEFADKYKTEYESFPQEKITATCEYYTNNKQFKSIDGSILYCMIRNFKPEKIMEIGSGLSTCLSAQAILKNKEIDNAYNCELTAVEPYPNDILKAGFPGLTRLTSKKVQEIPLSEFEKLEENDILFIDSSHTLKIGGDVKYEYLEILPRLKKGVIVHFHDIFLPAEYPKDWIMKESRFWTEQYLLQAFLTFNNSFKILWAGSFMNLKYSDMLKTSFSAYKQWESLPGSFWIKKIK